MCIRDRIMIIESMPERLMVKDTDLGKQNDEKIADLKNLIAAFRKGTIKERTTAEDMDY